jgi:3-hydroxyacyl-CoA dehydrogenase/enoyl-CoA hydratase/3-hydroxybutyryl-CoA epimerase
VVVHSAKKGGFIAGADIKEFLKIRTPAEGYELIRAGQAVLQQLEDLPCPSVAALHGFALGGGLELALACTYRVGADDPSLSLGFPEVLLGIHPGFGGTVRSVQLIGVRPALDLMLKGKPYKGPRALAVGLIDELVPPRRCSSAPKRCCCAPPKATAPFVDKLLNMPPVRPFVARQAASALRHSVRRDQYPAPYAIVDLWQRHGAAGAQSYEAEARSISELMCTPTSRNLVRVFMLQDRLKGLGGKSPAEFRHVHVIGAGVMGGDIAAWSAFRGMTVTLQDRSLELIQPGLGPRQGILRQAAQGAGRRGRGGFARLTADVQGDGAADADVVIEAIFENVEAKRALYAELEPKLKPTAILATNTSSIRIEILCANLQDPSRLVGIHFFNPVAQLQLVEIVQGAGTQDRSGARRAPIHPQARQAPPALQERARLRGQPHLDPLRERSPVRPGSRGPCRHHRQSRQGFRHAHGADRIDRRGRPRRLFARGPGAGGGVSPPGARDVGEIGGAEKARPQERRRLLRVAGRQAGKARFAAICRCPPDLEDRLVLPLLNEAMACLREGVIDDADLLDAGAIFATGFAPFRGGPLQYARSRGIANVVARLEELAQRYGERFRPDPGWQQFAA